MPTISKDQKVITLVNVYTVTPENQQPLIDLLTKGTEEAMSKMPGFISATLHRSEDGVRVVNYAQWASREHWQAIFTHPAAKKVVEGSQRLAVADYHLYEVAVVFNGEQSG